MALLAAGRAAAGRGRAVLRPVPGRRRPRRLANAAVLGVYAELDARVNAHPRRGRGRARGGRAAPTRCVTFPGADHAFFNDTGARYNAHAAAEAYRRTLDWFGRHLAERHRRHGGHGHDDDDDDGGGNAYSSRRANFRLVSSARCSGRGAASARARSPRTPRGRARTAR